MQYICSHSTHGTLWLSEETGGRIQRQLAQLPPQGEADGIDCRLHELPQVSRNTSRGHQDREPRLLRVLSVERVLREPPGPLDQCMENGLYALSASPLQVYLVFSPRIREEATQHFPNTF